MTAPTFRVTWDGVPQVAGDFADVYQAMAHGQREYEYTAYDPMEDLDHVTPDMSWRLGWQANGTDKCVWLYDSLKRTGVHIDPVAACDLCPEPIAFLPPVVLKQAMTS